VTSYTPTINGVNTNSPEAPVVVTRDSLVPEFRKVTFAFCIAAALVSSTKPAIVPLSCWAMAVTEHVPRSTLNNAILLIYMECLLTEMLYVTSTNQFVASGTIVIIPVGSVSTGGDSCSEVVMFTRTIALWTRLNF